MKKKIFKLPVTWEMCGIVKIEASSLDEAIKNFNEEIDYIPLPKGEYVDASFNLTSEEEEFLKLYNKD